MLYAVDIYNTVPHSVYPVYTYYTTGQYCTYRSIRAILAPKEDSLAPVVVVIVVSVAPRGILPPAHRTVRQYLRGPHLRHLHFHSHLILPFRAGHCPDGSLQVQSGVTGAAIRREEGRRGIIELIMGFSMGIGEIVERERLESEKWGGGKWPDLRGEMDSGAKG
jgi:hypothetical protein